MPRLEAAAAEAVAADPFAGMGTAAADAKAETAAAEAAEVAAEASRSGFGGGFGGFGGGGFEAATRDSAPDDRIYLLILYLN